VSTRPARPRSGLVTIPHRREIVKSNLQRPGGR
jgi:hypothetical protein